MPVIMDEAKYRLFTSWLCLATVCSVLEINNATVFRAPGVVPDLSRRRLRASLPVECAISGRYSEQALKVKAYRKHPGTEANNAADMHAYFWDCAINSASPCVHCFCLGSVGNLGVLRTTSLG